MLVLALTVSIVVLLFATGMSVTVKDVIWLWRRPVLLGKSALAMYVVAPVVPRKLIKLEGDAPYVFSLVSAVVSIPYIRWRTKVHARG